VNWASIDIVEALQPLTSTGHWYWRSDTGKLDQAVRAIETRTPWIYWHMDMASPCFFYNNVIFQLFNLIPTYCANCYKVVVVPQTVDELYQLCDMQAQLLGYPCKCGVEIRDDVPRNYGGYFYHQGLERGLKGYKIVRELVSKYVGGHVPCALKRSCTEIERAFGPSDKWEIPDGQAAFEARVETMFEEQMKIVGQTEQIRRHVKNKWVRFAHSRGDMTYLKYTDGKPLFEPYVLYAGSL